MNSKFRPVTNVRNGRMQFPAEPETPNREIEFRFDGMILEFRHQWYAGEKGTIGDLILSAYPEAREGVDLFGPWGFVPNVVG